MIHWSAIFIFMILGLLGLWVAFSFLNKNGLVLFSIIAVALTYILEGVQFGERYFVLMNAILMPLVYFALIVVREKYSHEDAKQMYFCLLATFGALFICKFLTYAYYDSAYGSGTKLVWENLSAPLCQIISFALVGFFANSFIDSFPVSKEYKYLRRAVIVAVASTVDAILINFLGFIGLMTFGEMIVSFLLYTIFAVGTSFAVAFLRKYLNREPIPAKETKKLDEDVVEVEVNQEEKPDEE